MPEEEQHPIETTRAAGAEASLPQGAPGRTNLWIEIAAVLALAVLPPLVHAIAFLRDPRGDIPPLASQMLALTAAGLQVVLPLLLVLWLRRERWSRFGITSFSLARDLPIAMAFGVASIATWWMTLWLWPLFAWSADAQRPVRAISPIASSFDIVLIVVASAVNGLREELAMRGYLIPRLEQVGFSKWTALLASSALFASYHVYQGPFRTLQVLVFGLVAGATFVCFRRLWPLVLVHAAWDVWVLLNYR